MGTTLIDERYELRGLVGSGGMAYVYLAHDEVLDRDVALKLLKTPYAENEELVERFRREARSAASLSHPHIVPVFDGGATGDGTHYITMEYLPGGTLKDRITREGALRPFSAPTSKASSTGTSSHATSSSPARATRRSRTSA
jgi:serine/threonine-protein kinase